MKAYLFSIGESTTELAKWSLERLGFEVVMIYDPKTTLWEKYCQFIDMVIKSGDEAVLRCDADTIFLKSVIPWVGAWMTNNTIQNQYWFLCGKAFCFHRFEIVDTTPMLIKKPAYEFIKKRLPEFKKLSRPETAITRIPEFYEPRRFMATDNFLALHGYKQTEADNARTFEQKLERNQVKDWDLELIEKLKSL